MSVIGLLLKKALHLFILATIVATATAGISDDCLQCICKMEGCESRVGKCNPDRGSLSCGPYQIKQDYWKDTWKDNKPPNGEDYQTCTKQMACSEKVVRAYMDRYGPGCGPNPTCEDYIRIHNGGPSACKPGSKKYKGTTRYWNEAKKLCHFETQKSSTRRVTKAISHSARKVTKAISHLNTNSHEEGSGEA